jgi:hypothetical protein
MLLFRFEMARLMIYHGRLQVTVAKDFSVEYYANYKVSDQLKYSKFCQGSFGRRGSP